MSRRLASPAATAGSLFYALSKHVEERAAEITGAIWGEAKG